MRGSGKKIEDEKPPFSFLDKSVSRASARSSLVLTFFATFLYNYKPDKKMRRVEVVLASRLMSRIPGMSRFESEFC